MMIKILKGILLYSTILFSMLLLMSIESIVESSSTLTIIVLIIECVLLVFCYIAFKNESLEEYVPKYFR